MMKTLTIDHLWTTTTILRAIFVTVLIVSALTLVAGWLNAPTSATAAAANQSEKAFDARDPVVADRRGATVITTDPPGSNDGTAAIIAFAADGRPLYHNDTYENYFDVDPVSPDSKTVMYVAGSRHNPCPTSLEAHSNRSFHDGCAEIAIERVNLTTGGTTQLHTAVTNGGIWHDVDRIDDDRLLVADIARDRVFVLNVTSKERKLTWSAEDDLDPDSGGRHGDWTHLNDVELLADDRIMVSLRNQDRVVFTNRDSGLDENWTLGAEDAYGILYEQHNPDYIPAVRGGPAVIIADSENNRIVEYQRTGSGWERTWKWSDNHLRWPRDADRLPGGHTLITDSQGNRVLELDENDEIVWNVSVPTPYEAERLRTGDESGTGRSIVSIQNGSQDMGSTGTTDDSNGTTKGVDWLVASASGPLVNGLLYVAPSWMTATDLVAAVIFVCTVLVWMLIELHWSRFGIRSLMRRRH